ALLCILGSASSAFAQGRGDFRRTFVTIAQSAPMPAAQAQPERQEDRIGVQRSAYAVSGVVLGATVQFDSSAFRDYKCSPSDQFDGFTWCQKTRQETERRGKFSSTYSILHSRGGVAVYIDRYLEPAFFGPREADDDIRQYSRNIGETPRITRMLPRDGFPNGILASWGKVELEPLDNDSIKALDGGGGDQPQKDTSSISSVMLLAPRKKACPSTVSVEASGSFGLRALIRGVVGSYALQL